MVTYFLTRGRERRSYQVRRRPDDDGYELVVIENERQVTERFRDLPGLLTREYQLLQAWQAAGWREVPGPPPEDDGQRTLQPLDIRRYPLERGFKGRRE